MKGTEVKGFTPAEKRVLIELVHDETPSGILTTVEKSNDRGIVVGRGEECVKKHSELGNEVLFNPLAPKIITVGGRTVTMINEDQIYGVFDKKLK